MASLRTPLLSLALVGKVGRGKSATGNSLLGTYRFEESNTMFSPTKVVVNYTVDYNGHRLKIFYTPGYYDEELSTDYEHVRYNLGHMDRLMEISRQRDEVIDAFLIIISSQDRFTYEETKMIATLEKTFGCKFLKEHCIIVITNGDYLDEEYDVWLKRQSAVFHELLQKCENRVLLVSNKNREWKYIVNEFKEGPRYKTREDILSAVFALQKKYPKGYSYEDYVKYANSRNCLLLESELEWLNKYYSIKLSEIIVKANNLKNNSERDRMLQEIAVLRFQIQEKDNGTGMLKTYLDTLIELEESVSSKRFCTIS